MNDPKVGVAKVMCRTFKAMGQIPMFHRTYFLLLLFFVINLIVTNRLINGWRARRADSCSFQVPLTRGQHNTSAIVCCIATVHHRDHFIITAAVAMSLYTMGQKNETLYSCPQFRQILTDFQNSFTIDSARTL